jgi:tRNA-dihydrouridine synthase C
MSSPDNIATEPVPNKAPKVFLAPMEGVVDDVIRELFTEIGGFDQCVTEFIRVTDQLLPKKVFYRYSSELLGTHQKVGHTTSGVPVFVQLLGSDPVAMAENAAYAEELGAPGIDINFGCPAKTVNRHDGGAALLQKPERLFHILTEIRKTLRFIPLTAKVRLGFSDKNLARDIAQAVDSAGAERLTVHARTKIEGYRPPAHWEYVGLMRDSVKLPVVANGDIWDTESYQRCRELSGCENVALGRPAFARPGLALKLKGLPVEEPSWKDIEKKWLTRFLELNLERHGEKYAVARFKQWTKHMGRHYPEAQELFSKTKRCTSESEVRTESARHRTQSMLGHSLT